MSDSPSPLVGHSYSQRLGVITPRQFEAALARFDLGDFVDATPISAGLFGQNVFVESTHGGFVLRGAPHYAWQFPKERLGAALLREHTRVPVAFPYLLDPSPDIFGWPYLLMPRLYGRSPADPALTDAERLDIARALGHNLAEMHHLTWPFAGCYDLASDSIQPFAGGFADWIVADTRQWLAMARANGATTDADVAWVEQIIEAAQPALAHAMEPCFVMNDYNPGNLLVDRQDGAWRVTGLFDLMEYYFADGEADLVRLIALYIEQDQGQGIALARNFANAYLAHRPARPAFAERFACFMLRDRLIAWEYGTRPGINWFPQFRSFRAYAEPFTQRWRVIAPDG